MDPEKPPPPLTSSGSARAEFLALANEPDAERFIDFLLPGVVESGNPFVDWFFGDRASARSALRDWMSRPSSEAYVGRVTLRTIDGVPVGGFIALDGSELASCRVADAMAAAKLAGPGGRTAVASRLRAAQILFPEVPAEHFYISRLWVSPEARGRNHGVVLMREVLAAGRRSGFTRFRADICSSNHGVLRLAQFFKLQCVKENHAPETCMAYTSWVRDDELISSAVAPTEGGD